MGVPYSFKYDEKLPDKGLFDRVPLSFYRKGLRPSAVTVCAKVFTFTGEDAEQNCRLTYQKLREEYGFCRQTIADALGTLRAQGEIERVRRDMSGTDYRFIGRNSTRYDVIPRLLRYGTIKDKEGIRRKLFTSEIRVLANIMTACSDPRNGGNGKNGGGTYRASFKQMAYILNLSETTVQNAIHNLIAAGIVLKNETGVNRFKNSAYRVHRYIYNYQNFQETKVSPKKAAEQEVRNVNARNDRQAYYDRSQAKLEARVDKYMLPATQDAEYKEIETLLRENNSKFRGAWGNRTAMEALLAKNETLLLKRRGILERLELEIALPFWDEERINESLEKVFSRCKECGDTGTLPNGKQCTCWRGGSEL